MFDGLKTGGWVSGLITSVVVGGVLAGVSVVALPHKDDLSFFSSLTASPTPPAPTKIFLGVSDPKAGSDQLYQISLPDGTVKQDDPPAGWRAADLEMVTPLKLKQAVSSTVLLQGKNGWDLPLINASGQPYTDVSIIGMFDPTHAAVIAKDDQRRLLLVAQTGEIKPLMTLDASMQPLLVSQGAAWLSTGNPVNGACGTGSSSLIRVSQDGTQSTVASSNRVIVTAVDGPSEAIAYAFDSGDMEVRSGSFHWSGKGKPLVWVNGSHLVLAQGSSIFFLDLTTGKLNPAGILPNAPSVGILSNS